MLRLLLTLIWIVPGCRQGIPPAAPAIAAVAADPDDDTEAAEHHPAHQTIVVLNRDLYWWTVEHAAEIRAEHRTADLIFVVVTSGSQWNSVVYPDNSEPSVMWMFDDLLDRIHEGKSVQVHPMVIER